MTDSSLKRTAIRLLRGLEVGNINSTEAYDIASDLDPVLFYWIVRYLRDKYPSTHQSSSGVLERVLELSKNFPELVLAAKKGEKDLVSQWFSESFQISEFFHDSDLMISELVDKLEG